ncbi:MAG: anthranilate phosphoribosyltransferase [Desulfovibrio sp.]|jgi:anthranilate synthase/phosphoribosyltransferase|nr:anthranilate phosphoribosyltransferase [Desulfovibrio sp.]
MFLLIDNYDSFTFNLVQAFQTLGAHPRVLRNDDPALVEFAVHPDLKAVCISPGPGHPDRAGLCFDFLRLLPPRVPVLGVCLGHQVLARLAGVPVIVAPRIMHGKVSEIRHNGLSLFRGLPDPLRAGRYHSLVAEAGDDNPVFAVTARAEGGEIMALEYRDRPWTGVQFHPESVLTPDGPRLLGNFLTLARSGAQALEELRAAAHAPQPENDDPQDKGSTRTPYPLSLIMDRVARRENLPASMARAAFARLMDGEMTPAQAGAFLLGLRAKGETPEEMGEAVAAVLARAVPVDLPDDGQVLDVVGTGGDGRFSFNCSSGTALTLAALGHKIVKHGNRSVSSRCGSADVLEGLGFDLEPSPEELQKHLAEDGFVFLFAPRFHPSFRHVMPIRRELGVRTLFNIMGPLVNPARPRRCFLGVADRDLLPLVARTLARMGGRRGAVVHGAGGYDELTTLGPADVAYVDNADVRFTTLDPAEYGFSPDDPDQLSISGPEDGTAVLGELLDGRGPQAMRNMLALNTGFALHLIDPERPLAACMDDARQAVADGAGGRYLRKLKTTGRLRGFAFSSPEQAA